MPNGIVCLIRPLFALSKSPPRHQTLLSLSPFPCILQISAVFDAECQCHESTFYVQFIKVHTHIHIDV